MFCCTDHAATLIRSLVHDAQLPVGAGLRLIVDPAHRSLAMSLSAGPQKSDQVHVHRDASIFIAPSAATRLSGETLDAQPTDHTAFFLRGR